ncbi:Alpha-N-acetylgalactosaminidase [Operophtera brumata]|uniref:Alpha-N-acetylgalactosaminidase n=1 Tax=Operophtera brumata TaxID=104452 RepID=A0A0L7LUL0_OPEBR|nr:Alpha-N-acetylgalactosaminidase [Operophtera brumata]
MFMAFVSEVFVLENGLARTPPMGWMSWGYYMCNGVSVAGAFFKEGYLEAGYEYIIIDDCWSEKERDYNGRLLHIRGLKFGIYTNIGHVTCEYYPGSKNYFQKDAETFSEWGVDYVKVDGSSWKTIRDIMRHFESEYDTLHKYHGPGHWNDPDMLIYGQCSPSPQQSRSHISFYAMLSAPLLLSCDMRKVLHYERKLMLNLNLIAAAQDPLGIMARPYKNPIKGDIYPSFSFLLLNPEKNNTIVSFTPSEYGLNFTDGYTVMNVFTGRTLQNITLKEELKVIVRKDGK